jgi:hypothetical protein
LHQTLCGLVFANESGVSRRAATVLRRICGCLEVANSLLGSGILKRFAEALKPAPLTSAPTQFVRLLIPLIGHIQDFGEFVRFDILTLLLKLISVYPSDAELHHALGNAVAQVLDQAESPAVFGQFDITAFFPLFESQAIEVVQSAAIGLSIAVEKSDEVGRAFAAMPPPKGVAGLCAAMLRGSLPSRAALMNCLARLAEQPPGLEAIGGSIGEIVRLIGQPIEDVGVWSVGHSFLVSAIIVLQNVAAQDPKPVAAALIGKLEPLLCPAVVDYTIDLVRMLAGCPGGNALQAAIKAKQKPGD